MGIYRPGQSQSDVPARLASRVAREMAREALRTRRSIPLGGDPRGLGQSLFTPFGPGLIPATVTAAITACSSASTPVPGSGNAQLWYWDPTTSTAVANPDDGADVAVLNWYKNSGTIAVGAHIYVTIWSNAYWFAGGDC